MTDKIILVVSFGTSYNNNRALTIGAIEKDIDEAFPDYEMRRAFTSQMVINILKKRDDLAIDNVEEALERALADGVKTVIIQPTHIMNGTEYHFKIKDTVEKYIDKFENIPIAEPLLISDEDFEDLIASITSKGDYDDDTAVVFMGHGSPAESNMVYTKLQGMLKDKGFDNYYIGTVEAKRLVPRMIEQGRFEDLIYSKLKSLLDKDKLTSEEKFVVENIYKSSYTLVDLSKETIENTIQTLKNAYPVLQTNPDLKFYVIKDNSEKTLKRIEDLIRNYCPEYTFDELEYDHELTGYEGTEKEPPLFRLAIEYTFDENGFSATVPAKSIRYNETNYTLDSITILPYFGCSTVKEVAGRQTTDGYLFLPDGSGTILEYYNNDGSVKTGAQNISVYGIDYAYEDLSSANNTANAQVCRMPVYGLTDYYTVSKEVVRSGRPNMLTSTSGRRGYVAIIEAGESLATITASLGTMLWTNLAIGECEYNTVYASFSMQQTDKVSLGASLGGGSGISKSIDTRYTGNYTIRYILLGDSESAVEEPTYVGMASAYRNYLISTGAIAKFSEEELKSQLPLYIQTLGSMRVEDTFLTFPVTVTKALTSFDDIKEMTASLGNSGVDNIKYILTPVVTEHSTCISEMIR